MPPSGHSRHAVPPLVGMYVIGGHKSHDPDPCVADIDPGAQEAQKVEPRGA